MNGLPTVKNMKQAASHETKRAAVALAIGAVIFVAALCLGMIQ